MQGNFFEVQLHVIVKVHGMLSNDVICVLIGQ